MTALVQAGRRHLPRGWADLGLQVAIWFGFLGLYQVVRGFADRNPTQAFENGLGVIRIEERVGDLFELTAANLVSGSHFLMLLVNWTYWNSEFTVVGLALLWVYLRRHDAFTRFRNAIIGANVLGLVGYVVLPTAPPRMFPSIGFINHHTNGVVQLAGNPYAAMPSLHAADALIVGVTLAYVCRRWWSKTLWLLWPAWVWFAVMASANHFWLDVLAGIVLAVVAGAIVHRRRVTRRLRPSAA